MNLSKSRLPVITAALGIAACILRFCLYRFGTDEKGLLIPGHPLSLALWGLTAAAAVFVLLQVWKQNGKYCRSGNFGGRNTAMAGCLVFAAGLLVTAVKNITAYTTLEFLRNVTGLLAVPALMAVAFCRKTGKWPFFGFHAIVCIALTLHTVSRYSGWSSRPQLQDSFFPMLGCLLLMLFSYYQTASDVLMGSRRMQLGTGLLAAFTCFAAIPGSDTALLYLTGGIWALTNLSAPTPKTENKEERQ